MKLDQILEDLYKYMPSSSCSFKYGQCSIEVVRLVKKALANRINNFKVIDGTVYVGDEKKVIPHTWIEYNGKIYDPTKSQFSGEIILYDPDGEYKDEYTPEEYINSYEEIYGISPNEV